MSDKLNEFVEMTRITNRSGVHRCSICNCVNNENIETNLGDYRSHMSFTNDPSDKSHFICIECEEAIQDLRNDFELDDQYNLE